MILCLRSNTVQYATEITVNWGLGSGVWGLGSGGYSEKFLSRLPPLLKSFTAADLESSSAVQSNQLCICQLVWHWLHNAVNWHDLLNRRGISCFVSVSLCNSVDFVHLFIFDGFHY